MSDTKLFKPLKVGNMTLQNRIGMSPLTRFRADDAHVPLPMVVEYYAQRASAPGTLIISEATFMSPTSGGYDNVPGIYNQAQIDGWKKVTDAVHAKGSYMYCQLWDLGRAADPKVAEKEGFKVKSSSAVPMEEGAHTPEAYTTEEVKQKVRDYAQAAKNAIAAGFDGVEIHGANGYLIDQFIQDTCNQRTDEYGGSIENRSRFAVEVVKAVTEAVGADKVGIRLSPWSIFQGMRMKDPLPQFLDVIKKIQEYKLAYLHLVQSQIAGNMDVQATTVDSLDWAVDAWTVSPLLVAGGLRNAEDAKKLVDEQYKDREVVSMWGRFFISTPDLVLRLQEGIPLNPYNRDTFYFAKSPVGYVDQPFSKEFEAKFGVQSVQN
ncbi:FMN-linked oxidoreductase [Diplogelasinospora grovesii]|uniref:FMN-linked oxidoreductase n=1 Tax=Diplogelasinospora grovesii TaxID=303347 RepID=A0AAN6MY22_9PEZI|nr:FMN-linked oxidoreductase [Diplogelasinospora grovesii]